MINRLKEHTIDALGHCPIRELSVIERILLATIAILPFQCVLQELLKPFSYLDELTVILLAMIVLNEGKAKRLLIEAFPQIIAILVFCILGLISNIFSGVTTSIIAISIDIFTCVKFPVTLILASVVLCNRELLLESAIWCGKVLVAIIAIFYPLNLIADIGMGADYRFGIKSYSFIFTHPTFLCWALAGILLLFLGRRDKASKFWIALTLFLICSTLRSKAIGFSVIVVTLLLVANRSKRVIVVAFIVGGIAALALAWGQIKYYYTGEGFARADLSTVSLEIANDYAPFGSGFATYGSNITSNQKYYSQLYYDYGLSEVWGLTPDDASYVSDSFWPTVIAQFGWLGLVSYVTMLVLLVKLLLKSSSNTKVQLILSALAYLLISTMGESAFFNPSSVEFAICLCLAMNGIGQGSKSKREYGGEFGDSERVNILAS